MSAFLVVYNRKEKPLEWKSLSPMMDRLSHRGPDGLNYILKRNVLISHHHLWITPEEYGEKQPLKNHTGNLVISFDGRIDNRDELFNLLNFKASEYTTISDASLVFKLYETLGTHCFERIIGPHSTVIVDHEKKRVVGVCDRLAERGFFYYIDNNIFIAASEETAILANPGIETNIDEKTVSYFFAIETPRDGSTFFRGIKELTPGSYLIVDNDKFKLTKYWEFEPRRIRYKNDSEYSEHYRELLEKSVKSRLRCQIPASIMLSGGLDSSSIAVLASMNNPHREKIKAISWTFGKLEQCDESKYISQTCDMYDLEKIQFNGDTLWPLHDKSKYFNNPNLPVENPYRELKDMLYSLCQQSGSRLVLNGWYADHYYSGYEYWLLDMIRNLKLISAVTGLIWLVRDKGIFKLHKQPAFRKLFNFLKPLKTPNKLINRYKWMTGFALSQISDLPLYESMYIDYPNPKQVSKMFDTLSFFNPCSEFFHLSRYSLELECPYRDIRLIEFILNIPAYELFHEGEMKYMAKKSMANMLPENIIKRNTHTPLTPLFKLGLQENSHLINSILKTSDEWKRYIDHKWLEANRNNTNPQGRESLILWQTICFVSWLNNLRSNNIL